MPASARPRIVVVGSLNVDHTLLVPRLPAAGETLSAQGAFTCFGGKGANQALAAARAGGVVTLLGCVGQDDYGRRYLEQLRAEGVQVEAIVEAPLPTGSAFIAVDEQGENSIIVNPGANHALLPEHIDAQAEVIRSADALLLQLECPLATVRRAAAIAAAAGVPVFLNPSPLTADFLQERFAVDTLMVNEGEAEQLTQLEGSVALMLEQARCERLIVTRGAEATLCLTREGISEVSPPVVTPVDTVGAGDSFAGAFVVASCLGRGDALRFANAAGALATLKPGAQSAIPTLQEIEALLAE